jgi:hypothetical protein
VVQVDRYVLILLSYTVERRWWSMLPVIAFATVKIYNTFVVTSNLYWMAMMVKKRSPAVATGTTTFQLNEQTKETSSYFASSIPNDLGGLRMLQLSSIAASQTIGSDGSCSSPETQDVRGPRGERLQISTRIPNRSRATIRAGGTTDQEALQAVPLILLLHRPSVSWLECRG